MDPVSLTLGVLPLLKGALVVYKTVRTKLKIFCHYSTEIERIRKLFGGQRDYFLNEIELVLRLVLQDQLLVKAMMKDLAHERWKAADLEKEFASQLGRNAESLRNIVQDISESMEKLQIALKCFSPLEEQHEEDPTLRTKPLKDSVKKLRKRVKITIDKKSFELQIDKLEKTNDRLRRLREQVCELERQPCVVAKKSRESKAQLSAEFSAYGAIRRASKALHEAFAAAWSSTQAPQLRHSVRLFLDAKAGKDVQMEVAILCYNTQVIQRTLFQTNLLRLEVRSRTLQSMSWAEASMQATGATASAAEQGRQKRQKVRFLEVDDCCSGSNGGSAEPTKPNSASASHNAPSSVSLAGHFCPELSKRFLNPSIQCPTEGLGHLDSCTQETFRHSFFPCSAGSCCTSLALEKIMLVDEMLNQPIQRELTVVGQLRLAHSLVSAVLKFNSTPWLNELWSVRDLAFFRQDADLTKSLQTLHLDVELSYDRANQANALMEVEASDSMAGITDEAQYKYGVRNMTLYSLGAALLAIGRWERIDPYDVEGTRRAASQSSYLSRTYQELTQKVLDCDFGFGRDLKTPGLQEAIYEQVVLELESMISRLDLTRD